LEAAGEILVFATGFSYVFVGAYLLRKAALNPARPEFYLGLAFLLDGVSYGLAELPFVADLESILDELSYAGRVAAGACSIMIGMFVLRVFRPDVSWAPRLIWICGALILAGLSVSAFEGDWEGMSPLTYKGLWLDWLGGLAPYVWLAVESFRQHAATRRGLRIGIGDALVCNRYMLIAIYGTFATITYFLIVPMYIVYERSGAFSPALDLLFGLIEIICLAALWMSFAAPAFYRQWVYSAYAEAR